MFSGDACLFLETRDLDISILKQCKYWLESESESVTGNF